MPGRINIFLTFGSYASNAYMGLYIWDYYAEEKRKRHDMVIYINGNIRCDSGRHIGSIDCACACMGLTGAGW